MAPQVHLVPPGVVTLVLPAGPAVLEIGDAPDLESLDLSGAGLVDHLRLVGCPRLALVQLRRDHPTLLSIDRPGGAVALRLNGLVCLAEATFGDEGVGLPQGPGARHFCRDGFIGPARQVPADVELIACIGPDSLPAVADHRGAVVRLAVADGEWATFRLQNPVEPLALVLLQACPRLAHIMVAADVQRIDVQRCHSLRRIVGSGFSARITDCHPSVGAGAEGSVDIGGPWRETALTNVGYRHVGGTSGKFVLSDAPSLELIANCTDSDIVVHGDAGRIVAGHQAAYPARLQLAVRIAVGLHPSRLPDGDEAFVCLPDVRSVQSCLLGLAALLPEGPSPRDVWRIREALIARVHELTGRDPTYYREDQDPTASWPCRNTAGADDAWQADLAIVEACKVLGREPGAIETTGQSGGDACIRALGNMRHIWLVRMLAQARAERVTTSREHAWTDEALGSIFGCDDALEPVHGVVRFVPQRPGAAPSAVEDGPAIVDHLLAARAAHGGEHLIDQCAKWLHNAGRRKGGLEMLGRLARAGNATALRALVEIPGGGGVWFPEDRSRAVQFVLAAALPVPR